MLKLLIGAALFVCCGYAGYGISAHYRKRYNLLVKINGYIDALENGISYLQNTSEELTKGYTGESKDDCAIILRRYLSLLDKGTFSKGDCFDATKTHLLSGYERQILADMLFSLGKSDLDTQLSELKNYRALFAPVTESAKQNYKKYGTLAFKLGILTGLAALLITA